MQAYPPINDINEFTLSFKVGGKFKVFQGRVIGYINDEQFAALYHSPTIMARKLSSMPGKDFFDLVYDPEDAIKHRLVLIEDLTLHTRKVIVSDVIEVVDHSVDKTQGEIQFISRNGDLFFLESEV